MEKLRLVHDLLVLYWPILFPSEISYQPFPRLFLEKPFLFTSNMIALSTVLLFPLGAQMRQSHLSLSVPELLNVCWKGIQCRILTPLAGVHQAPPLVNEKWVWPSECSAVSALSTFVFCFGLSHTLRSQALIFRFCSERVTGWLIKMAFNVLRQNWTVVFPRLASPFPVS